MERIIPYIMEKNVPNHQPAYITHPTWFKVVDGTIHRLKQQQSVAWTARASSSAWSLDRLELLLVPGGIKHGWKIPSKRKFYDGKI